MKKVRIYDPQGSDVTIAPPVDHIYLEGQINFLKKNLLIKLVIGDFYIRGRVQTTWPKKLFLGLGS